MKFGVILETKEYEKAWNAFRFATASRKNGHEVKVFWVFADYSGSFAGTSAERW